MPRNVKHIIRWELLLLIALTICGCEADDPEADIPEIPLINPLATAIPEQYAICIKWEANSEENLAGYRIYRSTIPDSKDLQLISEVSEEENSYEDTDVTIGIKYYYRISAINYGGNESDKSDVVSYTLLEKPILNKPENQVIIETIEPTFTWFGVSGASSYTIYVSSHAENEETWQLIWQSNKIYPYQNFQKIYNDDGRATEILENERTYRWRVDSSGGRTSGSQSQWRYFTVK